MEESSWHRPQPSPILLDALQVAYLVDALCLAYLVDALRVTNLIQVTNMVSWLICLVDWYWRATSQMKGLVMKVLVNWITSLNWTKLLKWIELEANSTEANWTELNKDSFKCCLITSCIQLIKYMSCTCSTSHVNTLTCQEFNGVLSWCEVDLVAVKRFSWIRHQACLL